MDGPGIPAEQLPRVFDRFWQAQETAKLGSGLGLWIAKSIVLAHGGTIQVESIVGKGSRFMFSTPTGPIRYNYPESVLRPYPDLGALKDLKVLLVDDSEDNQMLLGRMLNLSGVKVDLAGSGTAALEKASHSNYDLIFMDIEMPEMNGIEAARRIRDSGVNVPIVALTGLEESRVRIDDTTQALTDIISKPVSMPVLLGRLSKLTSRLSGQENLVH